MNKLFILLLILLDVQAFASTKYTTTNTDDRLKMPNANDIRGLEVPGSTQIRSQLGSNVQSALAAPKPYETNQAFKTETPKIEQMAQNKLQEKLGSPIDVSQAQADRAYKARQARLSESFAREKADSKAQFNRLGLASSSPGLQAQQDIGRSQTIAEEDVAAQIAREDVQRQIQAEQLAQSYIGQAIGLGSIQTGRDQFAINATQSDLKRQQSDMLSGIDSGLALLKQEAFQPDDIAFIEELNRQREYEKQQANFQALVNA